MNASFERVVVIGASAGGVAALPEITKALPASFPAPVCIVQHIGRNPSILPGLLSHERANRAVHAADGDRPAAGTIYIAPPDRHLLVEGPVLRVSHGAKENHARPAIDPLFRTAAVTWGPRVIGVVLTGQLDDGSAGLRAIKECGGTTVVQEPGTAAEPEMPASALAAAGADHCVPPAEIGPLLVRGRRRRVAAGGDGDSRADRTRGRHQPRRRPAGERDRHRHAGPPHVPRLRRHPLGSARHPPLALSLPHRPRVHGPHARSGAGRRGGAGAVGRHARAGRTRDPAAPRRLGGQRDGRRGAVARRARAGRPRARAGPRDGSPRRGGTRPRRRHNRRTLREPA
ncbi:chemotaxis protein CheB [Ramlibacter terrae]|uniref:protein-glutamate methylesterase n=1 Tax=Ramlibacter terrae TaxID=2732511 RepID=A0ABX6P287_9BURK|nr:chemotaxis protein CheB [Ramlibacter terrae]